MTTYDDIIDMYINEKQQVFVGVGNEILEGQIITRGDNFIELQRKWESSVSKTIWQHIIPTTKIHFIRAIYEIKKDEKPIY